jgi:Carboxypeptidase regulatory-like domain
MCIPASAKVCTVQTFKIRDISGIVLDENGNAIANAQVEVSKINASATGHTLTDANGMFDLPEVPTGKYELRVQAVGFEEGWLAIVLDRPKKKMNTGQKSLRIVLTLGMGCTSASLVDKGLPRD